MAERTYSSSEVAALTGATLRQLQWWDERGLIQPRHDGHARFYTEAQTQEARLAVALKVKGMSLQLVRKVFRQLETLQAANKGFREIQKTGRRPGHLILDNPRAYLITNGKRTSIVQDAPTALGEAELLSSMVAVIQLPGTANGNGSSPKVPAGSKTKTKVG
jgi:DNA-binding transcriptional MerR regulator